MSLQNRVLATITSIGRPIDLRYPSNRFAVFSMVVSFAVAFIAWLVNEETAGGAAIGAGTIAIAVFLAWALGRELDPDHPATGRWGALLALLFAGVLGTPSLLAAAVVMVAVRVLARTTGLAPRPTDMVLLVAAGILAAHTMAGAVAALVLATALVADLRHDEPAPMALTAAAAIAIVVGGAARLLAADPADWVRPDARELVVGGLVLIGLVPGPGTRLRSVGDRTGRPLDAHRLAVARRLAIVAVPVALLMGGEAEVRRLSPVVAGVVGLGINNLRRTRSTTG